MNISHVNLWIAHALGNLFLASVILLGLVLVLFSGAALIRLRHA